MAFALRVQEQARGLTRAGGKDDGAASHLLLGACRLVDVGHGRDLTGVVRDQLAGHRVREHLDAPGRHGRENLDVACRVVRSRLAAASALPAVVARGAAVARHGRDRPTVGDRLDPQLRAGPLDEDVVRAERRRRVEDAVRRAADSLRRAGDADEALGLVVVRRHVGVGDRPVEPEAVSGLRLEVVIRHPQRDAAIVVRASAEHARAEPREIAPRCDRVGLPVELSAAERRAVREPGRPTRVRLPLRSGAAMRHLVGPHVFLEVRGTDHRTRFQQEDGNPEIGQHLRDSPATGAGADHDHVVDGRARCDLCHSHVFFLYCGGAPPPPLIRRFASLTPAQRRQPAFSAAPRGPLALIRRSLRSRLLSGDSLLSVRF